MFEMAFEQLIEFTHAAPAAPAHAFEFDGVIVHDVNRLPRAYATRQPGVRTYARRSIISFLISAIANAGFRPFGQVRAQFMMVWQR